MRDRRRRCGWRESTASRLILGRDSVDAPMWRDCGACFPKGTVGLKAIELARGGTRVVDRRREVRRRRGRFRRRGLIGLRCEFDDFVGRLSPRQLTAGGRCFRSYLIATWKREPGQTNCWPLALTPALRFGRIQVVYRARKTERGPFRPPLTICGLPSSGRMILATGSGGTLS
jgi:hypothetical protein